jgi:hypothetical protein
MNASIGKIVIIIGVIVVIAGLLIYFFGNRLNFLGRLPGDIRIEKSNSSFYFPIVTCLLLSVVITLIVRIIQWFMR